MVRLSRSPDSYTKDSPAEAPSLPVCVNRHRRDEIPARYEVELFPYDRTANRQPDPMPAPRPDR